MASRPGRSSSIPIPRNPSTSSSTRNIESVISIPTISPSRPRLSSTQGLSNRSGGGDVARSVSASHRPVHDPVSVSVSPTRMLSRSATFSTSHTGRPVVRVSTNFEPRVVHATPDLSRSVDSSCAPSHSPTQARRASGVGGRSVSTQRSAPSVPPLPNSTPVSFPRPAYLDHSALRDRLITETPPSSLTGPAPQRKAEPVPSRSVPSHSYAMSPSDSDEDNSPSPPPPTSNARTVPTASVPEEQVTYPLPTRWSDQARSSTLSVSHDGRDLVHHGTGSNSDKELAANARANHFVPAACGIYYFEVEVRCKEQKSLISIGFCSRTVRFSRLPGWDPNSWGYYGDDGSAYEGGRPGASYAQAFGSGDIIGCGIDFTTHKMFYTKNQIFLGYVFDDVGKDGDIYPVAGLRHPGDYVRVNFGHDPFMFDIEDHVQQRRNATWASIMKSPLDSTLLRRRYHKNAIKSLITNTEPPTALTEDESKTVLNQLVLSYLVHHGYAKTARAFHKQQKGAKGQEGDIDMDGMSEKDELDGFEGDIERRTGIVNSIINGDIDIALEDSREYYPTMLEADDGLVLFKLRCRKLVELILKTNEIKRRISNGKEREESPVGVSGPSNCRDMLDDDGMNMDVDDDALSFGSPMHAPSLHRTRSGSSVSPSGSRFGSKSPLATVDFETALTRAIEYGQSFNNDYKLEKRPELRQMFEQASSVIAWDNPFEAGGDTAEVAGQQARITLANEVNEAILKSQGRPVRPTLEMVYRQTVTCMTQLGVSGVGSAVYADMPREFLET
ncbi:SPRY-domain-containing protein [Macrolepiota fuliginosa MF-IS2]|uniref:SPRY-domain-containing protein n=1 Tax=Macrolepiota fuliginosa MF-IS2 TaxID=1400762 RepID=A0A9P5XSK3_9AGAR|nr:SPRY-domain-containing protein [Macrolepiota fuliginosa MF-IS2]